MWARTIELAKVFDDAVAMQDDTCEDIRTVLLANRVRTEHNSSLFVCRHPSRRPSYCHRAVFAVNVGEGSRIEQKVVSTVKLHGLPMKIHTSPRGNISNHVRTYTFTPDDKLPLQCGSEYWKSAPRLSDLGRIFGTENSSTTPPNTSAVL